MADGVRVDDSQVRRLAADLGRVPASALPAVRPVVQKGALNIKKRMQQDASGHPTFPHFPRSITYDTKITVRGGVEAEIGPDKERTQGALGNILYFGTSNNAPVLDIESGLREEAPRFEKHLGTVAAGLLGM